MQQYLKDQKKLLNLYKKTPSRWGNFLLFTIEKLDKQDRIDAVLFEKIEQVDAKTRSSRRKYKEKDARETSCLQMAV